MNTIFVESSANKIIKEVKSLSLKKNRWLKKEFIIEGIKGIEQVLKSNYFIKYIVYSPLINNSKRGSNLLEESKNRGLKLVETTEKIFKELSKMETPQWVLAVVEFNLKGIEDIPFEKNTLIYFDNVQDPGNMGTMIRTSEALGGTGIIFTSGSVDIYSHKVVQASMGAILEIPIYYFKDFNKEIEVMKNRGIKILSTTLETENYLFTNGMSENICIVMGNEGSGVSENIIKNSDELIKIPMVGKAESLNVSSALSIILYEKLRCKLKK